MSAAAKSQPKPIVFVVDDDISVRESLELLIKFAGWVDSVADLVKTAVRLGLAPAKNPWHMPTVE